MGYSARILKDSVSIAGCRLATFAITFPRIVLAEFNTHRMLSRNSASSRAIPVEKRIAAVEADPFVPEAFGRNQRGMQAGSDLEAAAAYDARAHWMHALRAAVLHAKALSNLGVHKQLANRILEPFLWHTVIVSATEWSNFFALRCHPDAQPEIRKIALMMREAYEASNPRALAEGEWHLPLVEPGEQFDAEVDGVAEDVLCRVSVGRCARVSYLTHDGKRDPAADVALADRLATGGHMSPFEHVAQALSDDRMVGNFRGWMQYRKRIPNEHDFGAVLTARNDIPR